MERINLVVPFCWWFNSYGAMVIKLAVRWLKCVCVLMVHKLCEDCERVMDVWVYIVQVEVGAYCVH